MDFNSTQNKIHAARKVMLVSHRKPDGDALGSMTAMMEYLLGLGKHVGSFVIGPVPDTFDYLANSGRINQDERIFEEPWDVIIIMDCSNLEFSGLDQFQFEGGTIINIDHHATNIKYGHINCVGPNRSSTCEIIFDYFDSINFKINKKIATSLLTGIATDTSFMQNGATTADAVAAASRLVSVGAKLPMIVDSVLTQQSLGSLKIWGLAMSRLRINKKLNAAVTYLRDDDFIRLGATRRDIDGLANFLNALGDVNFSVLADIDDDGIKVSMRTTRDDVDVAHIASYFGGGGHKKAAGFRKDWNVKEADGCVQVI